MTVADVRAAAARAAARSVSSRTRRSTRARSELSAWVAPVAVSRSGRFLRAPTGPQNAAVISGAFAGDILLTGIGAGGDATAVAMIGDLLAIARDQAAIVPAPVLSRPNSIKGYAPIDGELASCDAPSVRAAEGVRAAPTQRRLCERAHRTAVSSVQDRCFRPKPSYVCDRASARSSRCTTTRRSRVTREEIEKRPKNLWRYRELLPIEGEPRTGFHSGFTPLVRCTRLAERLGLSELYIKDDSVNHPTLSYKDRVVSVAATRAMELGFKVLACASTGNLAN